MDLISIIISAYNVESYLKQCLDSVVNQTFKNIEIIIVNDASNDNSLFIIEEYAKKDNRIIIIDLKKNAGLGNARNIALQKVSGKYVFFLDADDWLDLDILSILYNSFTPQLDIVSGIFCFYDNTTGRLHSFVTPNTLYKLTYNNTSNKNLLLTNKSALFATAKLYRMEFLNRSNLVFENFSFEDFPFIYKAFILSQGSIFVKKAVYYYRRKRAGSITVENKNILISMFKWLHNIKNFLKQNRLFDIYENCFKSSILLTFASVFEMINLNKLDEKKTLADIKLFFFDDKAFKLLTMHGVIFKIRMYIFHFCVKYNIRYSPLMRRLRKIFYFM